MLTRLLLLSLAAALPLFAEDAAPTAGAAPNTLTEAEKAAGWQLLFDGQSTKGWHAQGKADGETPGWIAEGGELKLKRLPIGTTQHKDIYTEQAYTDFELTWQWKVAVGGNSGLKYNLPDKTKGVGCEYQMLDDEKHPDGNVKDGLHRTASLYDLIPPPADKIYHAGGEWNESRIVVKGAHVEHWLNGAKTVEYDYGSDALKKLIAASKFKSTKGFGEKISSPFQLQDHGDEVSVRSIKVRTPAK